ncbi:MAG: nitroreductase [Chlamydiae bacterium]|nr:MAG: nitroreductase [Chlamydiota bacterium]
MIKDLIRRNRSYRRFDNSHKIPYDSLRELIDFARLSPSGANLQSLKFIISNSSETNLKVFPQLAWAGYLKDWDGPIEKERPSAYIIILGDKNIKNDFSCDCGIAAQSILLGATEKGLGGCMIGSIKREELAEELSIDFQFEILLVIALGKPVETVQIEETKSPDDIKYWRDEKNIHHVPKRSLNEIILREL